MKVIDIKVIDKIVIDIKVIDIKVIENIKSQIINKIFRR